MEKPLKFTKASSVAVLLASVVVFATAPMSWDVAHAKDGRGKHRIILPNGGHGGGNAARATRGGGQERTRTRETVEETAEQIRRRLHQRDAETTQQNLEHPASNASPTAFAHASPNSRLGRITAARKAAELERLGSLTDEEVIIEFPNGGYYDAVIGAVDVLNRGNRTLDSDGVYDPTRDHDIDTDSDGNTITTAAERRVILDLIDRAKGR